MMDLKYEPLVFNVCSQLMLLASPLLDSYVVLGKLMIDTLLFVSIRKKAYCTQPESFEL